MFTKLLQTVRSNRFLKNMLEEFASMLDDTHNMYSKVLSTLHEGRDVTFAHDYIYETDIRVNKLQQNIRRKLLEHLTITGVGDLPASLILMSVIKDAERLGDYSKNMYEVAGMMDRSIAQETFWESLKTIQYEAEPMFGNVKLAFMNSDKKLAGEQLEVMKLISKQSDELIDSLYVADLSPNHAISYALLARYAKRIANHLGNIASAVVVPLPMLDFLDEPGKK